MTVDQKRLNEFAEGAYGIAQLPYQVEQTRERVPLQWALSCLDGAR
jgi:hypothetical protein